MSGRALSLPAVTDLLDHTADALTRADTTDVDLAEAEDAMQASNVIRHEARLFADRIREACERAGVNGTPRPGPIVPLPEPKEPPPPPPPPPEPEDTAAGLDAEATRLQQLGLLRLVDLTVGHLWLVEVTPGGLRVLGEVEGTPEGMTRELAPEGRMLRDGIRDVLYLTGEPPADWGWLASADKVPARVGRVTVPYGLRVRIATAAFAADSLAEDAGLVGQLARAVDDEILALAKAHGDDNGTVLDPMLTALATPIDRRLDMVHHRLLPDQHPGGEPELVDLDGTPRDSDGVSTAERSGDDCERCWEVDGAFGPVDLRRTVNFGNDHHSEMYEPVRVVGADGHAQVIVGAEWNSGVLTLRLGEARP